MKFQELAEYLEKLEGTSSRIVITEILADLFKRVSSQEISMTTNLLLGRLAPNYENLIFNVAEKMMLVAISRSYQTPPEKVRDRYKKSGDLGLTAYEFATANYQKSTVTDPTITDIYQKLREISQYQGGGSQEEKIEGLSDLLRSVEPLSAKFIARIPIGKLRLGFSDKTVIDALSWMAVGDKSVSKEINLAYEVMSDVGRLAQMVKQKGVSGILKNINPEVGVPVQPMLAQRLKSPDQMIQKMGEVAVEPKYDGLRVLIHFKRGRPPNDGFVKTFTRNLNETSWMFPEIQNIGKSLNVDEIILDSEAVGLDESTRKIANFQVTMTRRRKHGIGESQKKVSIQFYVFDVLLVDGKNLMRSSLLERRKVLESVLHPNKVFKLINQIKTKNPDLIRKEHRRLLDQGLEGVIVKKLDSEYVPGRTGWRWVKMKEAEEASGKLADTLDCVIMGYTTGKGKRAGFGMGQFLAGVLDGEEIIKTITKVGTGLTDEQLEVLAKRLDKIKSKTKPKEYVVHKDLEPDFWVEPVVVVELAADEITNSPNHSSGYALRFPRLIKFRDDKDTARATTMSEVKKLFEIQ